MARCANHPSRETAEACDECGQPFCDSCLVELLGRRLCGACRDATVLRLERAGTRALWVARAFDVAGLLFSALGAAVLVLARDAMAKPQVVPSPPGSPPGVTTIMVPLYTITPREIVIACAALIAFLPPLLGLARGRRWAWRWQVAAFLFPIGITLVTCLFFAGPTPGAILTTLGGTMAMPVGLPSVLLLPYWLGRTAREALAVS